MVWASNEVSGSGRVRAYFFEFGPELVGLFTTLAQTAFPITVSTIRTVVLNLFSLVYPLPNENCVIYPHLISSRQIYGSLTVISKKRKAFSSGFLR